MENISAIDQELKLYVTKGESEGYGIGSALFVELSDRYSLRGDVGTINKALLDIFDSQVTTTMGMTNKMLLGAFKQIREMTDNECLYIDQDTVINIDEWLNKLDPKVDRGETLLRQIANNASKAQKDFEDMQRKIIEDTIKSELMKLNDGETIPLNSPNCEGNAISILTYNDCINYVNKDGSTTIYGNSDCSDMFVTDKDENDIWGFPLAVTIEIAKCVSDYMKDTGRVTYLNEK